MKNFTKPGLSRSGFDEHCPGDEFRERALSHANFPLTCSLSFFSRNQISDLIARHKEAEVRRMEIEKAHQTEISAKQAELDEQRRAMNKVRDYHKGLSAQAKAELDQVRQQMQHESLGRRDEIGQQMG